VDLFVVCAGTKFILWKRFLDVVKFIYLFIMIAEDLGAEMTSKTGRLIHH